MRLTTRSCRLGGTISARMKRWRSSGSTAGCAIGSPAFGDGPVWCRKRSRWSTPPSHCLPPTTHSNSGKTHVATGCLTPSRRALFKSIQEHRYWSARSARIAIKADVSTAMTLELSFRQPHIIIFDGFEAVGTRRNAVQLSNDGINARPWIGRRVRCELTQHAIHRRFDGSRLAEPVNRLSRSIFAITCGLAIWTGMINHL